MALSRKTPALKNSVKKKKIWAPPDFERQTTHGISLSRSFLSSATRSSGYWSMSSAPNLHWLFSLMGIEPTPCLPSRCATISSKVSGFRTMIDFAFCFPARLSSDICVCPCAALKPSNAAMNRSAWFITHSGQRGWGREERKGNTRPLLA